MQQYLHERNTLIIAWKVKWVVGLFYFLIHIYSVLHGTIQRFRYMPNI